MDWSNALAEVHRHWIRNRPEPFWTRFVEQHPIDKLIVRQPLVLSGPILTDITRIFQVKQIILELTGSPRSWPQWSDEEHRFVWAVIRCKRRREHGDWKLWVDSAWDFIVRVQQWSADPLIRNRQLEHMEGIEEELRHLGARPARIVTGDFGFALHRVGAAPIRQKGRELRSLTL